MGRMGISVLLPSPEITSITIADKNYELAVKFANLIESDKVSAVQIDVMEEEKLVTLVSEHDLVLNTVGPFYQYGLPILKAVIKAKRNYIDICDDWKPTLKMLELSEEAKAAGITAIIGIGASPGLTNLMAVKACSELDEVDAVITGWGLGSSKAGKKPQYLVSKKKLFNKINNKTKKSPNQPNAALLHLVSESMGKIPTFQDGRLIEIEALTESEPLKFPGGGRGMYACHIGHPEPITLPRTLSVKSVSNVMYLPKYVIDRLRGYIQKIKEKTMTKVEVAIELEKSLNKWWIYPFILFWLIARFFRVPPELCVIVSGRKGGKPKKVAIGIKYRPYGEVEEGMDGVTAIPLVIAAHMLIAGKIPQKGVLTPEDTLDPDEFFTRYAQYCKDGLTKEDVLIQKIVDG